MSMRRKNRQYRRVMVVARDMKTFEEILCYQGDNVLEARKTVQALKREDFERRKMGDYIYSIIVENLDGTRERWLKNANNN